MELTFPSFPYQVSALFLLFALLFQFLQRKNATKSLSKCKLPPGPRALPFIGNLHNLVSARVAHQMLRDLARTYGPVMLLRTGQTDLVVITSREAAQEVMQVNDVNFSERPMLSVPKVWNSDRTISLSNGPYWRHLRRICVSGLLSPVMIKSFSLIRHEEVRSMLKWLSTFSGKSPVVLAEKVSEVANNVVARAVFGGRCKRQEMFLKTLREIIKQTSLISPSDLFPWLRWLDDMLRTKYLRTYRILDKIIVEEVQEHMKKQKQRLNDSGDQETEYNLVDLLTKEMENHNLETPVTFDSVKAAILDMFAGGTDTTTATIEWAMAELIRHPEKMAKVQEEVRRVAYGKFEFDEDDVKKLNYLKLVIRETLRLHPPVPLLLPRRCKESCKLLGYLVPSGARVIINAWALGRDPEYWKDSEEFIPERFEDSSVDLNKSAFEYIPFGAGRRRCPGGDFAMVVVEIALSKLLLYFDWKLPENVELSDVDMTEDLGASCHMKKHLSLIPVLRVPLPDV